MTWLDSKEAIASSIITDSEFIQWHLRGWTGIPGQPQGPLTRGELTVTMATLPTSQGGVNYKLPLWHASYTNTALAEGVTQPPNSPTPSSQLPTSTTFPTHLLNTRTSGVQHSLSSVSSANKQEQEQVSKYIHTDTYTVEVANWQLSDMCKTCTLAW